MAEKIKLDSRDVELLMESPQAQNKQALEKGIARQQERIARMQEQLAKARIEYDKVIGDILAMHGIPRDSQASIIEVDGAPESLEVL